MLNEVQRQRLIEASSHKPKRTVYANMNSHAAAAHMEMLDRVIQNIKLESPQCFHKETEIV